MTKRAVNLDEQLIQRLADGQFHSGQDLATELGVSRTAINKHMNTLEGFHLDIFRVHGKGYRLAQPLQLLQSEQLQAALPANSAPLYVKHVTTSTHDDLKILLSNAPNHILMSGTCVLAEMQTHGRGRRGRNWLSPFGSNLYASFYWPLPNGLNSALGLSVAVGLGLAQLLQHAGIEGVSVKWPNDVFIQGNKVAGILIELEGEPTGMGHALIGIGLNLNMPDRLLDAIGQPFTDVQQHLNEPLDRHVWAANLILHVRSILARFEEQGLHKLTHEWQRLDHFYGKPIRVLLGQHEQQGIGQGIDDHGALLVRQENGLKRYFGGEISIRAK